jgi:hypothetical protein
MSNEVLWNVHFPKFSFLAFCTCVLVWYELCDLLRIVWSGTDCVIGFGLCDLVRIDYATDFVMWYGLCVLVEIVWSGTGCVIRWTVQSGIGHVFWYRLCDLVWGVWSGVDCAVWYRSCVLVEIVWSGTEYVTFCIFTDFATNLLLRGQDPAFRNSGIPRNVAYFYQAARLHVI